MKKQLVIFILLMIIVVLLIVLVPRACNRAGQQGAASGTPGPHVEAIVPGGAEAIDEVEPIPDTEVVIEVEAEPDVDVRGAWNMHFADQAGSDTLTLALKGTSSKPTGTLAAETTVKLGDVRLSGSRLVFTFAGDSLGYSGVVQMSATVEKGSMLGFGVMPDGGSFHWTAERTGDADSGEGQEGEMADADEEESDGASDREPEPLTLAAMSERLAQLYRDLLAPP